MENNYRKKDTIFDKIKADLKEQETILQDYNIGEHDIIDTN